MPKRGIPVLEHLQMASTFGGLFDEMLARALRVACPVVALHGDYGSHPVEGIRAPLEGKLPTFRITVLPRCGHDPWKETYAWEAFFDLLQAEMVGER